MSGQDIEIYTVDAFTDEIFKGNPAAICLITNKLTDSKCYKIAAEMNLSETAFVECADSNLTFSTGKEFNLRWFTPTVEVPLCGHATLATAHVIIYEKDNRNRELIFHTLSGPLVCSRAPNQSIQMMFPAYRVFTIFPPSNQTNEWTPTPEQVSIFRSTASTIRLSHDSLVYAPEAKKLLIVLNNTLHTRSDLECLKVDLIELQRADPKGVHVRGVCVTIHPQQTPANTDHCGYDFVSRYFAPWVGINEDPATGSLHCALVPYWTKVLAKTQQLKAYQCYPNRGAEFVLNYDRTGNKVALIGQAVTVLKGTLLLS